MTASDRAFAEGFHAALDAAERASVRILQGKWGHPVRREHAGAGLCAFVDAARAAMIEEVFETSSSSGIPKGVVSTTPTLPSKGGVSPSPSTARTVALSRGYTGDCCPDCFNLTMVRNGTCLKCETCGSTTGCS